MKRQYRGCSALHLTCNQYAVYEAENDAVQLHYISPHAENENEPTVHFSCGPQMRITQQPVTRSGEWDIKIRRLGCTSSRCVAVWQRVLICCVVCGALGQMCPLCTRLRALSTWAGVKRRTGRLKSFHQVEYSHNMNAFSSCFTYTTQKSFWMLSLRTMCRWSFKSKFHFDDMQIPGNYLSVLFIVSLTTVQIIIAKQKIA